MAIFDTRHKQRPKHESNENKPVLQEFLNPHRFGVFLRKLQIYAVEKKHIYTVSFGVIVIYLTLRAENKNLKFKYQSEIEVCI